MKYLLSMIAIFIASVGYANENQIILKTKKGIGLENFTFETSNTVMTSLIDEMSLHLLHFSGPMDSHKILQELRNHPDVIYAQLDHKVSLRETPNDDNFNKQWSMVYKTNNYGIDAQSAWDEFGTGGKDVAGNDIVVAIVDGGMGVKHPDLKGNVWTNHAEIAGNNKDDDGNGYVDDINGWNAYSNNGKIDDDSHGSHVAGIVGAQGNNNLQVTGVNWDVKLMAIPGASGTTSVVLRAYNYALKQKILWLESNGQEGANVVSTNSSFGIDGANCNKGDYPAWNDIYNKMGEAGILSAAATANNNVNVDNDGDVPTGCDSDYLITVTNSNKSGNKAFYAGYGKTAIDIAAPGEGIFSTLSNGGAGALSGTSMATPHIAGSVAYLHSVASTDLNKMFMEKPGEAAKLLKDIILSTVRKRNSLKSKTVSGGILDLFSAAQTASEYEDN